MPTGYTGDIYAGRPITFRQYALKCARAMGALIMMRDEPMDAPIKLNEPSTYSKEKLEKAEAELNDFAFLTSERVQINADNEYEQALEQYNKRLEERRAMKQRYEAMLEQVLAWEPPTPDHKSYKKLMVEQLKQSIEFDTDYEPEEPRRQSAEQWRASRMESIQRDIKYHTKAWQEEQERTSSRNKWITDLLNALPEE